MSHSEIMFIGDFTCVLKFGPNTRTVKPMLGIVVQLPPPKRNLSEPSQVRVCGEICAPKSLCFPFIWECTWVLNVGPKYKEWHSLLVQNGRVL